MLSQLGGIGVLVPLLEHVTGLSEKEELLLNTVSAITNLSFYYRPGSDNVLLSDYSRLSVCLVEILLHDNDEAVTEAARAFGNISRNHDVSLQFVFCLDNNLVYFLPFQGTFVYADLWCRRCARHPARSRFP